MLWVLKFVSENECVGERAQILPPVEVIVSPLQLPRRLLLLVYLDPYLWGIDSALFMVVVESNLSILSISVASISSSNSTLEPVFVSGTLFLPSLVAVVVVAPQPIPQDFAVVMSLSFSFELGG